MRMNKRQSCRPTVNIYHNTLIVKYSIVLFHKLTVEWYKNIEKKFKREKTEILRQGGINTLRENVRGISPKSGGINTQPRGIGPKHWIYTPPS